MAPELEAPDVDPPAAGLALTARAFRARPHDAAALAFGLAFVVFGALGLLRALGAPVPSAWLYPVILLGLGVAGLSSLFLRELR